MECIDMSYLILNNLPEKVSFFWLTQSHPYFLGATSEPYLLSCAFRKGAGFYHPEIEEIIWAIAIRQNTNIATNKPSFFGDFAHQNKEFHQPTPVDYSRNCYVTSNNGIITPFRVYAMKQVGALRNNLYMYFSVPSPTSHSSLANWTPGPAESENGVNSHHLWCEKSRTTNNHLIFFGESFPSSIHFFLSERRQDRGSLGKSGETDDPGSLGGKTPIFRRAEDCLTYGQWF